MIEELDKDAEYSIINEAQISQPSCTAIQIALTDLLRAWNVTPTAVTGHSSGEIAAAYAAGILSLESCMAASYYRGLATIQLKKEYPDLRGSMMAVGCTKEEMEPLLESLDNKNIRIACYNSPTSLTISGDTSAIDELQVIMEGRGMFNRKLQVDVAYHSEHMSRVAMSYRASLSAIESPKPSEVKFFSSLYGNLADHTKIQPEYWVENLTQAVRFTEALSAMVEATEQHKTGVNMLIEIGPHSALGGPVKQILKACGSNATKISYTSVLVRKRDAVETALDLASTLFVKGASLSMSAVNLHKIGKKPTLLVDMPRYPWNHATKYWHEPRVMQKHKYRTAPRNDLLGVEAIYSNDLEPTWRNIIRIDDLPWLRHHKIQGLVLFPMSGFVAMAVEAANQHAATKHQVFSSFELRDLNISTPLVLTEQDVEVTLQLRSMQDSVLPSSEMWNEFRIHSWTTSGGWTEHCRGLISVQNSPISSPLPDEKSSNKSSVDLPAMYKTLDDLGVSYGTTFQGLRECRANTEICTASITKSDTSQEMPVGYETDMIIHPSLLEQLISTYWPVLGAGRSPIDTVYLPSSIERLSISRRIHEIGSKPGDSLQAVCQRKSPVSIKHKPIQMSMWAAANSEDSEPILVFENLTVAPIIECTQVEKEDVPRELCYRMDWELATEGASEATMVFPQRPIAIIHGESEGQLLLAANIAVSIQELTGSLPVTGILSEIDSTDKICLFILEIETPLLATLTVEQFTHLQNALTRSQGVLWIVEEAYLQSKNPDLNMITGLSRSIRSESLLKLGTLDLEASDNAAGYDKVSIILQVLKTIFHDGADANCELEFAYRNGQLLTPRIVNDDYTNQYVHKVKRTDELQLTDFASAERQLKLSTGPGMTIGSLHFVDQIFDTCLHPDEVEIEVKAISLNPRDSAVAIGEDETSAFGQECSGIVLNIGENVRTVKVGARIAGVVSSGGAFATNARIQAKHVFELDDGMSFEDGASCPLAYSAARYVLDDLARVDKGETVLIHGAETALGQALINMLQVSQAEVTAAVTNADSKARLLASLSLFDNQILVSSVDTIRQLSSKQQFDHIINCSATNGDTLKELWLSLDAFGRFVDCARQSATKSHGIDCSGGNKQFSSLNFDALILHKPNILSRLMEGVAEHHRSRPQPLSTNIFSCSEIDSAFKVLQAGNFDGKIIISPQPGDQVKATPSAKSSQILRADATYILIGGTGGLGRSMTRWMLSRGARNLVLVSRTGSATGKVEALIAEASEVGAKVVVRRCNVANSIDVERLIHEDLVGMPEIRGVVHGAMVLNVRFPIHSSRSSSNMPIGRSI